MDADVPQRTPLGDYVMLRPLLALIAGATLQGCMVATATMAVGSAAVAVGGAAVSTATTVGGAVVSGTSAVVRAVTPKGKGDETRGVQDAPPQDAKDDSASHRS